MSKLPRIVVFALWATALVQAQDPVQSFAGRTITAAEFDPPATRQPLLFSDLNQFLVCEVGKPFEPLCVTRSIEELFSSGRYEDIVGEVVDDGNGGVKLLFRTTPAFFVGEVRVSGVPEPPTPGQLNNATRLQLGTLLVESSVKQAVDGIQELLRSNGFFQAQVTPRQERDADTEVANLYFDVQPGDRAKITTPRFNGNLEADPERLLRVTHWRRRFPPGFQTATDRRVQNGVERLRNYYRKQDRLLARVTLYSLPFDAATNEVTPVLQIDAGPKVRVRTSGVRVSRGKLRQLVPVFQEQAVDRDLLLEGQRNIEGYFESQGYFQAQVSYVAPGLENKALRPDPTAPTAAQSPMPSQQEQLIEYRIVRGPKSKLAHLEVTGNRYFDTQSIRDQMSVQEATLLRYRNGRFSEALLQRDISAIRNLYRANGFLNVNITSKVDTNYQGRPNELAVVLNINEGQQATVRQLVITGAGNEEGYFRERLQSIEGQPFSESAVAEDQDLILTRFLSLGYIDADVDVRVTPLPDQGQFDVNFNVQPGDQQFVRRVLHTGLDSTSVRLFYQRVPLKSGDPLSLTEITEAQRRLYDLGIFAQVDVAVQNPEGRESLKYVQYRLEEARRYALNFGLGFEVAGFGGSNSLDNAAGVTGFSPRVSFGVTRINFLGVGHSVSLQGRVSTLQQRAVITYLAPQFIGRDDLNLSFSAIADRSRDVRTYVARRLEGTLQVGQRFSRATNVQYRFTYRQVNISDLKITPAFIPLLSQPVRSGIVSVALVQDRRDDPIDSTRGYFNSIDFGYAAKILGSRVPFLRFQIRNNTYHRIANDVVIARSTTFGALEPFGGVPAEEVPLAERFFTGGGGAHRGFPTNQAGPRDLITGFPIGGNVMLTNQTELRFPILGDNLRGVLFHDAGNVYSQLTKVSFRLRQRDLQDFNYMVHAAGFGLRYRTPAGPIRIDLSYTLNPTRFRGCRGSLEELVQPDGPCNPESPLANFQNQRVRPIQFHFSFGQTF